MLPLMLIVFLLVLVIPIVGYHVAHTQDTHPRRRRPTQARRRKPRNPRRPRMSYKGPGWAP